MRMAGKHPSERTIGSQWFFFDRANSYIALFGRQRPAHMTEWGQTCCSAGFLCALDKFDSKMGFTI